MYAIADYVDMFGNQKYWMCVDPAIYTILYIIYILHVENKTQFAARMVWLWTICRAVAVCINTSEVAADGSVAGPKYKELLTQTKFILEERLGQKL